MCLPFLAPLFAAGAGGGAAAGAGGLGAALSLVGAGLGAVGQIQSANASAKSLEAQAQFNERQAAIERQRGSFEADRARDRARRVQGQQVANFAASGVQLEGSPAAIIDDSAAEAALDVQSVLYGSELRADNQIFNANINRLNAGRERSAGRIGALTPLIRGASRVNWGGIFS